MFAVILLLPPILILTGGIVMDVVVIRRARSFAAQLHLVYTVVLILGALVLFIIPLATEESAAATAYFEAWLWHGFYVLPVLVLLWIILLVPAAAALWRVADAGIEVREPRPAGEEDGSPTW